MNSRERILAAVLAVIVALLGGNTLLKRHRASVAQSNTALQAAREQLQNANMTLASGRRAMKQLDKWQTLSLPTNRDVARSLYHGWLLKTCKDAGLNVEDINPNEQTSLSTAYQSIGYVIEARGTLSAVTKFLYEFYRSARLQQITKLQLTANPGSSELRVQLRVEALILPGSTHDDSLPEEKSDRLKLASAGDYEKSIVGRDLFKAYTPPRPPREATVRTAPRPAPEFDHAAHAKLTGVTQIGLKPQAWIRVQTTGESFYLHEGDEVKVGDFKGKIEAIEPRAVVIKTDAKEPIRVRLGHTLREPDAGEKETNEAAQPAAKEEDT